jgi:WD40 repeat protein
MAGEHASACPPLEELEAARPSAAVRAHVARCTPCRLVVDLIDERSQAAAQRSNAELAARACARFEPLLAAEDGELTPELATELAAHLAICADCRMVVAELAPLPEAAADHVDLPQVETTAYSLGAEVARGGMGRILAARDLRVGRPVAVKELLGRSPALAARFEREARVTARLQHPGIVPIYEIGRWPDGTPFYAMRLVDGRTLREALRDAATPAARLALLPAVTAAAEAVAFAHSRHVIHRDLTPSNILVGAYGETVVIDWGLAKDRAEPDLPDDPSASSGSGELTGVGQVIGTATYMPPEQATGAVVDARADVYSLGAILYQLLAGVAPYTGRRDDVLAQVKAGPPRPIEVVAPETPRDLISIVTKAMAHDPAQRYATARELVEELNRFQTGRLVQAHVYSRGEMWRRWIRRRRAAVVATAVALLGIAIAATISVSRVIAARDRAVAANAALLEEQGRQELLAGNPMRAAAWLSKAYSAGNTTPSLRLLLGTAMRDVELLERTLDCGSEAQNLALDPAGTRLLAACGSVVKVWRIDDGVELVTLSAPGATLTNARFSPDGATIVTWGLLDATARLWDARTGALLHGLAHGALITAVAFTADDRTVVTIGADGNARVWTIADGRVGRVIAAASEGVRGDVATDGTLVTLTRGGQGSAWDLVTGTRLGSIEHGASIVGGNLSRALPVASTCGLDGTAKVWDTRPGPSYGARLQTITAHHAVVLTCELGPDGQHLLTTSQDGSAKITDIGTGRVVTSVAVGGLVADGRFSPDGERFTTVGLDGSLRLWSTESGALIAGFDDPRGAVPEDRDIHVFDATGARLFAARKDGTINVLDLRRVRLRRQFPLPPGYGELSVDGTRVTMRSGGAITGWDVATGTVIDRRTVDAWDATPDATVPAVTPFVVGVAPGDPVARVSDATGRELIAFPFARIPPTPATLKSPPGEARFHPDRSVVIVAAGVSVWELPMEHRSPEAIAAIVAERVAWRITSDGTLVER